MQRVGKRQGGEIMTGAIVLLMTLMFLLPSDGSAQSVPSPGERIRIKQVDGTVLTGRLTRLSPETIQLFVRSDYGTREVSVENIEVLETSLGRSSSSKNVAITMVVGAVVGAAIGDLAWEPCTSFCVSLFQTETRSDAVYAGLGFGFLVGFPVGFLIRSERWNPVSLPAPVASDLSIRPVIGSRLGLAGSLRVGGF